MKQNLRANLEQSVREFLLSGLRPPPRENATSFTQTADFFLNFCGCGIAITYFVESIQFVDRIMA